MKWEYVTQSMCVNIWKLGISYPAKYELHCFSNFLHSEPIVAKILPPYILEMDQFYCMEAKYIVKSLSAKIANLVFILNFCRMCTELVKGYILNIIYNFSYMLFLHYIRHLIDYY
jgi:hypothetical protein